MTNVGPLLRWTTTRLLAYGLLLPALAAATLRSVMLAFHFARLSTHY